MRENFYKISIIFFGFISVMLLIIVLLQHSKINSLKSELLDFAQSEYDVKHIVIVNKN